VAALAGGVLAETAERSIPVPIAVPRGLFDDGL